MQPWAYSGKRSHPTEKDVRVLKPVIQAFTQPGAVVLDPFSVPEQKYCQLAEKRLAGVARHMARGP